MALNRTVIRAPVDGVVVKRAVQLGQMVQPGTPLMTVIPVGQAYVNANFKEGQLKKVRIGQPAELISDLYGDSVVYHGHVVGFSGGTGASQAIPAQNATGNWIKVVQRLPVRVALEPQGAGRPSPQGRAFHGRRHQRVPLKPAGGGVMTAIASPANAPARSLTGASLIATGLLIGLGNFLVVLDTTIANVSVPTIAGSLGVSSSQGTWVITSMQWPRPSPFL